ncbi:MAG: HupE/UreJ family protein, partial [Gammaproteobacteria bacterium]|nr:HupE/UreJ family protein [Gammaproteobacteria bacterium]
DYQLFFEVDAQHRGLAKISTKGGDISYAFSPDQSDKLFEIGKSQVGTDQVNLSHSSDTFFRFLSEGIWHIWIGFDHMLFLISLLLPAVLLRYRKNWIGIKNFSSALSEVIKVVTAFTVAHSLTLSLVMFEQISLPVMFVESIIAFSVIVVALNNLYPLLSQKRWLLGLFFGLIHGFGFANVLSELELGSNALFMTMLGFNIGVEIGQLAIVLVFMPVAYLLRNGWFYQNVFFKFGSVSIAGMGCIWFVQRTLVS